MSAGVVRFEFDLALLPVAAQIPLSGARSLRLQFRKTTPGPPVDETPSPWSVQLDSGMPLVSQAMLFALDALECVHRAVLLVPVLGGGWVLSVTTASAERIEEG